MNSQNPSSVGTPIFPPEHGENEKRLSQLNVAVENAVFTVAQNVDWTFYQQYHGVFGHLTQTGGNFLDLGEKSWLFSGTATGLNRNGAPMSLAWSFEYSAVRDSLTIGAIGFSHEYVQVSAPDAEMQVRHDVSGKPLLLIFRKNLVFYGDGREYSYMIAQNSYLAFA